MSKKYDRLVEFLAQADDWIQAGELADRLGVSTRSIRSYVTAAKAAAHPFDTIQSSPSGYRINREAYSAYRSTVKTQTSDAETPRDRIYQLVRRLGAHPDGLDLYFLAEALFVSDSTIEQDLRKVKTLVEEEGLALTRRGSLVVLSGTEANQRRLLSRMFHEESVQGFFELERVQREFESANLSDFKTDLIAVLGENGFFVNEYGLNNVLLHLAIALERSANLQPALLLAADTPDGGQEIAAALDTLVHKHFAVSLSSADVDHLTNLLTTRVLTPGQDQSITEVVSNFVDTSTLDMVRRLVGLVRDEYLIDLDDEEFMVRLALHVRNLVARAQDKSYSPNPMTRSMKTSYPMIYEVAVFIASQLQRDANISINDDEIAYLALHVGSYLERQVRREARITCALVCPNYYDIHVMLRQHIEHALGDVLDIDVVITRTDVDWSTLNTDLVLTTIGSRAPRDNEVVIQPFLTDADVENIRRAITTVRRHTRRLKIKDDLLRYFTPALFFRDLHAGDEIAMIQLLGKAMIAEAVVDDAYVRGAIERERMSSTAFTDNIAVPHAMAMTASQTSIAIAINETPMPWGENRVNVIAFIAFSEDGRNSFQEVFDQFVEVFADRADVQRIIKRATDFPSFIEELVRVIDK
jgi:lichenan operon transcriptional antiterminator